MIRHKNPLCFLSFVLIFASSLALQAQTALHPNASLRSTRVEELFIWKISEELKLSVKEEKDVSSLIRELNQRKSDANEKIDAIVQKQAAASDSEAPAFLKDYRAALAGYNKISLDEVDRIEKILPKTKAAKYFVVKADLSKRIRSLLALPEHVRDRTLEKAKSEPPPMEDPKIIEE